MPSDAGAAAERPSLRTVLASPKMMLMMALGAASGFPNQVTESALQAIEADAAEALEEAVRFAQASPFPPVELLGELVYARA